MTTLSLFCGLFGCQKAQKSAKHDFYEITAVSISCGNMDRRYGYSFWAHKEENGWFWDAECFTHDYEREVTFENRELDDREVTTMLEILKQNDSIAYAENYKESKRFPFRVADEETYVFCLNFSDESRCVTSSRQNDLEKFFYRLAENRAEDKAEE